MVTHIASGGRPCEVPKILYLLLLSFQAGFWKTSQQLHLPVNSPIINSLAKSISQPEMLLLILNFHGMLLLVFNAFTWSPSVSASLGSSLPSNQPVKAGRLCFFPPFKRILGTTRSFIALALSLSRPEPVLHPCAPHLLPAGSACCCD